MGFSFGRNSNVDEIDVIILLPELVVLCVFGIADASYLGRLGS